MDSQYIEVGRDNLGLAVPPDGRNISVDLITLNKPHHMTGQQSEVVVTVSQSGQWVGAYAFPEESDAWRFVATKGPVMHVSATGSEIVRDGLGVLDAYIVGRAYEVDRAEDPRLAAALDNAKVQADLIAAQRQEIKEQADLIAGLSNTVTAQDAEIKSQGESIKAIQESLTKPSK